MCLMEEICISAVLLHTQMWNTYMTEVSQTSFTNFDKANIDFCVFFRALEVKLLQEQEEQKSKAVQ